MTQLSRPYQIALLTMALFVAVWFLALRGHSAATPEPGSATSAPAVAGAPAAGAEAKSTPAPSHSASVTAAAAAKHAASVRHAAAVKHAAAVRHAAAVQAKTNSSTGHATPSKPAPVVKHHSAATAASPQKNVEAELKAGKTVAILFWNPKGTVDAVVSRELFAAARALGAGLAVHQTGPGQVGAFGSITREVQIDLTPTIMLISKTGRTTVITGLTDTFAITQAISELRS